MSATYSVTFDAPSIQNGSIYKQIYSNDSITAATEPILKMI